MTESWIYLYRTTWIGRPRKINIARWTGRINRIARRRPTRGKVRRSFTIREMELSRTSPSERDYTIRPANHWALRWWTMTMTAGWIFLWQTTRSLTNCIVTITTELLQMWRYCP